MKKLAIVTTHPIQYNAPWFQLLAERSNITLKVFYTWSQSKTTVKDKTFGKNIQWDIPLLEGYNYEFIENVSKKPGSHHFFGIDNPELINALKSYQPEAILFFGWNFKSNLKAMRYFHGRIPVWFRGDSTLLDETGGFKTKLRHFILTLVYRYVDKAFYVGEANKAYFLKHGLKEHQLVYAPHAIDNNRFYTSANTDYETNALQWRTKLNISPKDKVILFGGKFEAKKNPMLLIKAFNELSKTNAALKLVMLGSGNLESALKEQAGHNPNIIFLDFQNQLQMPIVYRLADVFCLPSQGPGETWGLAVNEALASGRPVLVSDKVGCAADLVTNNVGRIFKWNDREDLKEKLNELILANIEPPTCQQHIFPWSFDAICGSFERALDRLDMNQYPPVNFLKSKLTTFSSEINIESIKFPVPNAKVLNRIEDSSKIRLAFVGSLISAKGIFELEDILRQLHSKNIPFSLHIIGSGAEEAQLKATLKAFETVSFKGKLLNTEVLELHQNHDIILLPSKTEGLPVVLVEAMKYGVVPMATKLESGIPEIIEHGVNGFTIPLDEVSNYANHIEQLHHNRSQLKKMSKLCIEKSEQLFNPKDQAKLFEDVLCKTEETKKHIKKNIFDFLPIVIANRIQNYFRK